MGNENSTLNYDDYKDHSAAKDLPMPHPDELNQMFHQIINDMDLTPDRINELHRYDNPKKWEMVCEQNKLKVKNNSSFYLTKIRSYLRSYALHKKKFRKVINDSTKILRELEIALRTNHVGWTKDFIESPTAKIEAAAAAAGVRAVENGAPAALPPSMLEEQQQEKNEALAGPREQTIEERNGLDLLSEYLSFALYAIVFSSFVDTMSDAGIGKDEKLKKGVMEKVQHHNPFYNKSKNTPKTAAERALTNFNGLNLDQKGKLNDDFDETMDENYDNENADLLKYESKINQAVQSFDDIRRIHSLPAKRILKNSKILSDKDDVHIAVLCVRAIMNFEVGFKAVLEHPTLINQCTLAFQHPSAKTKALVLDLLSAIALVKGGHEAVLGALKNYQKVAGLKQRFQIIMVAFKKCENDEHSEELATACMQFINIIVHSVDDMNYRVHFFREMIG